VDGEGVLYVADGMSMLALMGPDRLARRVATFATGGFPGFFEKPRGDGAIERFWLQPAPESLRGIVPVKKRRFFATGLDQVAGLAIANDNDVLVAESSTGRVLQIRDGNITVVASDLGRPMGIACESDGRLTIADAKYGRILRIHNGDTRTLVTGLREPHGLAIHGANYFVVDRAAKTLLQISREDAVVSVIASHLPIGTSAGANQRVLSRY